MCSKVAGLTLCLVGCAGTVSESRPTAADPAASTVGDSAAPPAGACGAFELAEDNSVFHFVADRYYTWEPGITLHVRFLDGKPENMRKVAEVAREWSRYANLDLEFHEPDEPPPAGAAIQVSFQRSGYWSLIGSQAAHRESGTPTMNFNFHLFEQGDVEIRRVVLHEFGHALGLWHEHQNPNQSFTWNKEAVYDYYQRTNGWDRSMVDTNILAKLDPTSVDATDFDAKSIMVYSFPRDFTVERIEIPYNSELSETDKREIAKLYPGRWSPDSGEQPAPDPEDVATWAGQIGFRFVIESTAGGDEGLHNYSIAVVAPPDVLAQIDHVLYQRQHATFAEYQAGTYFRSAGRERDFGFAWQGWGWVPIEAKVVFKNGQVSDHMHRDPPEPAAAGPDWDAIRQAVRFAYTATAAESGGWRTYRIELAADPIAEHVHYVEYQRQHDSFGEYTQGSYLRRDARDDRFALAWRGYGWIPIAIRVQFKDGSSRDYRVDQPPTPAP